MNTILTSIKIPQHRHDLTKLRVSAHLLLIERGRYSQNRIERHLRFCTYCDSGELDDEKHFLLSCSLLKDNRNKLFDTIIEECPNFRNLNSDQRVYFLLTAGGKIIRAVAKFCMDGFKLRSV